MTICPVLLTRAVYNGNTDTYDAYGDVWIVPDHVRSLEPRRTASTDTTATAINIGWPIEVLGTPGEVIRLLWEVVATVPEQPDAEIAAEIAEALDAPQTDDPVDTLVAIAAIVDPEAGRYTYFDDRGRWVLYPQDA
jgi:hypothetical protein